MFATTKPNTRLFLIDDEGVLFAQDRQEIYALNTAAAYLWCRIEDGVTKANLLRDYAATFGVGSETATAHLSATLESFFDIGLVDLPGRTAPVATARPKQKIDYAPPYDMPPKRDTPVVVERYYRLLETNYLLRYSDPAQVDWVETVLKNFAIPPASGSVEVIDVQHDGNEIFVYRQGMPVGKCDGLDTLAPVVKNCVWTRAINNFDYFLNFHAGAVTYDGGCLLLPASAGSGKSSTTAGLVHGGFRYLSDEVALLGEDCLVRALPLAMCFKDTGWHVATRFFSEIADCPAQLRGDGKVVKYYSLPERFCAETSRQYPVKAIIFPSYTPESATEFVRLSKTKALAQLFRECVSIPEPLSTQRVARMVSWITKVDCFTLQFSDLDDAIAAIRSGLRV